MATGASYYSYRPLVTLDAPVVFTALPGTPLDRIVRMVAGLTGLRPLLVDRRLSHVAGHHPDQWTATGEHHVRWEQERAMLAAAFSAVQPVVALASHSLVRQAALPWLRERARTVYVREPVDRVVARMGSEVARDPHRHWVFTRGAGLDARAVRAELEAHDAVLAGCDQVEQAVRDTPHGIAIDLLEPLGLAGD